MVLTRDYETLSQADRLQLKAKFQQKASQASSNTDVQDKLTAMNNASTDEADANALAIKMSALYTALVNAGIPDSELQL